MDEPANSASSGTSQPAPVAHPSVDVEKLAEKVYELMRAELRLARARGERREKRK